LGLASYSIERWDYLHQRKGATIFVFVKFKVRKSNSIVDAFLALLPKMVLQTAWFVFLFRFMQGAPKVDYPTPPDLYPYFR